MPPQLNLPLEDIEFPWDDITYQQAFFPIPTDLHEYQGGPRLQFSLFPIISRVFEYQQILRQIILKYLYRNTFLDLPDFNTFGIDNSPPFRTLYNMVENNLRLLIATDIVWGIQLTKIWHGWTLDERPLDYTDINRWFQTLQLHLRYIKALQRRYFLTNTFLTGVPSLHQAIGIPQMSYPEIGYVIITGNWGRVTLSSFGRYKGSEISILVSVGDMRNIMMGDILTITLNDNGNTLYTHTHTMNVNQSSYAHAIPQSIFVDLPVGEYPVNVTVSRIGTIRTLLSALYYVVAVPTFDIVEVIPNVVSFAETVFPKDIIVKLKAQGEGIDRLDGSAAIIDTLFDGSAIADGEILEIPVQISSDIDLGWYSIMANLTITSDEYGEVTLEDTKQQAFKVVTQVEWILGTLPANPDFMYRWDDTAVWDDDMYWRD